MTTHRTSRQAADSTGQGLSWLGIARLGLVQAALGAVVVLTTSTLNRVMVVELALPALLPGLLVALHYVVQVARPRMGFGSDVGGRRTPWIFGGIVVLALGGFLAAVATAWMGRSPAWGTALATLAFLMVGLGVSASGTSLLVLLAKRVDEPRRATAAATVWVMMIVGFIVTAGLAGHWLDPYSPQRLVLVSGVVSTVAVLVAAFALAGVEGPAVQRVTDAQDTQHPPLINTAQARKPSFREALAQVWAEPDARRFTIFVFVSMLAYSAQDLILEPFAGIVFGFTPGESTKLSSVQHSGALAGMLLASLAGRRLGSVAMGSLRAWTVGGCLASCLALLGLVAAGAVGPLWPLRANVFLLGVANGAFSIAAIGSMMGMAGQGRASREGVRMGLWGAAQAIAFGLGGVVGTAASDVARVVLGAPGPAYATVFFIEAVLFVVAATLAARIVPNAPKVLTPKADAANDAAVQHRGAPVSNAEHPSSQVPYASHPLHPPHASPQYTEQHASTLRPSHSSAMRGLTPGELQ
jgi:MFS transporter, BCD family, chlorophyll transporter